MFTLHFSHIFNSIFASFRLEESPNARRKRNYQQSEADRWLKQAQHDLESSYNDMHSPTGNVAYDWACYKCYRVRFSSLFSIKFSRFVFFLLRFLGGRKGIESVSLL